MIAGAGVGQPTSSARGQRPDDCPRATAARKAGTALYKEGRERHPLRISQDRGGLQEFTYPSNAEAPHMKPAGECRLCSRP